MTDFASHTRKELQDLLKAAGLKGANKKTDAIIMMLQAHEAIACEVVAVEVKVVEVPAAVEEPVVVAAEQAEEEEEEEDEPADWREEYEEVKDDLAFLQQKWMDAQDEQDAQEQEQEEFNEAAPRRTSARLSAAQEVVVEAKAPTPVAAAPKPVKFGAASHKGALPEYKFDSGSMFNKARKSLGAGGAALPGSAKKPKFDLKASLSRPAFKPKAVASKLNTRMDPSVMAKTKATGIKIVDKRIDFASQAVARTLHRISPSVLAKTKATGKNIGENARPKGSLNVDFKANATSKVSHKSNFVASKSGIKIVDHKACSWKGESKVKQQVAAFKTFGTDRRTSGVQKKTFNGIRA